jgi:Transcription factor IIIC subunit delta bet-propeller domain
VLTSNLVLSIWEVADGRAKWTRVLIVNQDLRQYFTPRVGEDEAVIQRKQRIRSFSWSPSCEISRSSDLESCNRSGLRQHNWGFHFLVIANDSNDVVFVKISGQRGSSDSGRRLFPDVLSHYELQPSRTKYPQVQPDSLFAASLRFTYIVSHISWGPWNYDSSSSLGENTHGYSSVALLHGSDLKIILVKVAELSGQLNQQLWFHCRERNIISQQIDATRPVFTGPVSWIYSVFKFLLEMIPETG